MKKIVTSTISFYQRYLSFDRGMLMVFAPNGACKYLPTCSEYTKSAVEEYGVTKGITMGIKRIWSCR